MSDFNETWISQQIFEKAQVSNFIKIRPVVAELFQADWHEANIRFSQFCESAYKE
jgi:hypothetical protein